MISQPVDLLAGHNGAGYVLRLFLHLLSDHGNSSSSSLELTAATALAGTDVLPIVDVGADATKKVSVSNLLRNLPDGTASAPALAFAD